MAMDDLESGVSAEGLAVEVFDGVFYGGELRMRFKRCKANVRKKLCPTPLQNIRSGGVVVEGRLRGSARSEPAAAAIGIWRSPCTWGVAGLDSRGSHHWLQGVRALGLNRYVYMISVPWL